MNSNNSLNQEALQRLLIAIRKLHAQIRDAIIAASETSDVAGLARVAKEEEGDTIYAIDRISEELLIAFFNEHIATTTPIILIAEGLSGGQVVLPQGTQAADALWRIIVDPIDGTRGLMYQKRSGWILTGVAPNKGPETNIQDILLAVQTEIPTAKQHLCDVLWAVRGQGMAAERFNRLTGESQPLHLQPSKARTIAHGFFTVSRFFPGAGFELAAIDEEIVFDALGPLQPGKAQCFEDQYICSGGQMYELMAGHDRFVADLRPLMDQLLAKQGLILGLCCHPYDICTELIAREMGLIIVDVAGNPISVPLNVEENVTWVGYANRHIRAQIEPLLQKALRKRDLL